MWAILGGSGFEKFDGFNVVEEVIVDTPFGAPSAAIQKILINDTPALFLSRHGKHHEYSPSHVNYCANIFALKKLGASKILSLTAVGSLRKELAPGDCVLPIQYIDRTKALRQHTFCSKGIVGHVSLAHPVDRFLAKQAKEILSDTDFTIHFDKTYVCIEGPTFSTQAESHQYRQLGADVIGMTGFPEVALAREAGLYYLPFSFVTDYDSWDDTIEHVTLAQVLEVMRKNNAKAFALIQKIIPQTHQLVTKGCAEQGLKNGLMTPMASLSPEVQSWLQILTQ